MSSKLLMFKTAYSTELDSYVEIIDVFFKEGWGEWWVRVRPAFSDEVHTFKADTLRDYCL